MTLEQQAPGWPKSLLEGWPGLFRHAQLVRWVHGTEVDVDPVLCLLEGLSAARKVDEVLEEFADNGEFQLAERLLAESGAVSERARARFADLEPRRAERASELATRLRSLADQASAAGLQLEIDEIELSAQARVSWPSVDKILTGHRDRISQHIRRLRDELTTRNHSPGTDPQLRAAVDSLIAVGRLTLARRMLENEAPDFLVPEAQPALQPWRWSEPVAEVLSWHIDPSRPKPPEFGAWRTIDAASQHLVEATEALGAGGSEAAREFAIALERFHYPDAPEPTLHEIGGGWLSTVTLFRQAPLTYFRPTAGLHLLILPPGVQSAPVLPGVDTFLAVGPDLQARDGFRTGAAVLNTIDILRLVTLPGSRAIGLARIVGAQWPLSALGAGTPAGLARLLSGEPRDSQNVLAWLCNLAGVGGSATAEDLAFKGGEDAPLLHALLMNLVDSVRAASDRGTDNGASGGQVRQHASVGLERVVLRDCPDPLSRAAFWAALEAAPPGVPLDLDSLVIAAVLSPAGDAADWESVLRTGFDQLREQWFVDDVEGDAIALRPLGVIGGLRSLAKRRLADCASELNSTNLVGLPGKAHIPQEWSIHRFALSGNWDGYQQDLQSGVYPNPAAHLDIEPDELIDAASELSGSCDLTEVAKSLIATACRCFPAAELIVEIPSRTLVSVPERVLITVLYELLENALEATERAGKILLAARADDRDVLIDVFDEGPGLSSTITRSAQVFRPGFSTRGQNRGTGLYLARRLTDIVRGELEVADRSDGHPVFKGAHFTLILPGGS